MIEDVNLYHIYKSTDDESHLKLIKDEVNPNWIQTPEHMDGNILPLKVNDSNISLSKVDKKGKEGKEVEKTFNKSLWKWKENKSFL